MKRLSVILLILVSFFAFLLQPTIASVIYLHDDGSAESTLASNDPADTNIWLNSFQVVGGGEVIKSIDIAFGSNAADDPPPNGTAMTAYLWTDPTNDGNPLDAVVATSVVGTVQLIHTDSFINFALPSPVTLDINDWFFAGFQSTGFAVGRDTDSSAGQSWVFSNFDTNPLDPNNLGGISNSNIFDDTGFPGNALIRANADPIPEPATIALLGIGLAGLAGAEVRRRRKKKAVDES